MQGKKVISGILAAVLTLGAALTGCSSGNGNTAQNSGAQAGGRRPTELHFMLMGDKPNQWDSIETEFEKETKNTLNVKLNVNWVAAGNYKDKVNLSITAKEDYDLVFDAPWCQLKNIAPNGGYLDLAKYFNNSQYPGLEKAFSKEVMENNKFFGKNYAIPVMRTYGSGIQCVYYRQDLADKYGIGQIDSYAKLQKFFDAIQAHEKSMTPLGVSDVRGFYQLVLTDDDTITPKLKNQDNIVSLQGFEILLDAKHTKVEAIAADGDPDSSFSKFPAPFNRDFTSDLLERRHQWNKYLEKDSLNQKDPATMFTSGKAAAIIGTLDDYENDSTQFATSLPNAKMGEFMYNPETRNMEKAAVSTTYQANNFLCVPSTSTKVDKTMKFLDWLFADQKNHDLFELGIEGKNWIAVGSDAYKLPNGVTPTTNYTFPGYVLTWNKNYVRFDASMPDFIKKYKQYELKDDTFYADPLAGFTFDNSKIKTETARVQAITDEITNPLLHGILANPTGVRRKNTAKCRQNGLNAIQDELVKQLNEYLSKKNK
jgi:putative aldouronate transport system substrate-binding protein